MMLALNLLSLLAGALLVRANGGDCSAQPEGSGPKISPDTQNAFLNSDELSSLAKKAGTPSGWKLAFQNLHASSTTDTFLGVAALDSYDPANCTQQCNTKEGCKAVNIFFERAPLKVVGKDCRDPDGTTLIKCTFWGTAVSEKTATNSGYQEELFVVAIAGSNGYNNESVAGSDSSETGASPKSFVIPSSTLLLLPLLTVILTSNPLALII